MPDFSASSFLNSSPSPSAANVHAGEDSVQSAGSSSPVEDWLATVQLKLKLFESQAAAVSQARHAMYATLFYRNTQIAQAYAELRANFAAAVESQNTLHELFAGESAVTRHATDCCGDGYSSAARCAHVERLKDAESENAARERHIGVCILSYIF